MTKQIVSLYFDGACAPVNPGGIATGGWLIVADGQKIAEHCQEFCRGDGATNNVAEWEALQNGLQHLAANPSIVAGKTLLIHGDSQLVVYQLSGQWKCNKPHLKAYLESCRKLISSLPCSECSPEWIRREQNAEADELSKRAYEQATGNKFPSGF